MKKIKRRKKPAWSKFIVDGKTLFVFSNSRIPKTVRKLTVFKGIELGKATEEERKYYLGKRFFEKQPIYKAI